MQPEVPPAATRAIRRGKDSFTGEDSEVTLHDWLPSLQRAAAWNGWTDGELILQLAGHLRGRALQEWNLLDPEEEDTYDEAVAALRGRLEAGGQTLAAQDFRHMEQKEEEPVRDFIRRLEKTFKITYGRDPMSGETRDTLLHGQLQEGLRQAIMSAPAVSGAQSYKGLCLAAKNEERRLSELRKRRQYHKAAPPPRRNEGTPPKFQESRARHCEDTTPHYADQRPRRQPFSNPKVCTHCGRFGHLVGDCRQKKTESTGPTSDRKKSTHTNQVMSDPASMDPALMDLLFSSSDEEPDVRIVRVHDEGSQPRCAPVQVQGIPGYGIIDSGADITIISGGLFRKVATAARLRKKDLQPPD